MKQKIISLGSSCNTATILKHLGVNKIHYFFDFIWNEFGGLRTVKDIVENDFKYFDNISNYTKSKIRLNSRNKKLWNINKYYPSFVFFHQDTTKTKIIKSINRKIQRTRDLFTDGSKKYFIYYRPPIECLHQGEHSFAERGDRAATVKILKRESLAFVDMYKKKYDDNFCLISMIKYRKDMYGENEIHQNLQYLRSSENENLKFDYVFEKTSRRAPALNPDGNLQSYLDLLSKYNLN